MTFIFSIFVFILGLIIGSFLNCLIWRLYKNESVGGRSYCPHCHKTIAWYDNIPVLSFMILGGRCRYCHEAISYQYPLVEIATAILFLLTWQIEVFNPNFTWLLAHDWLIIVTLMIIFVYDLRWQMIPMNVLWPMTALIFIINIFLGYSWFLLLEFGAIAVIFFLAQYLITKKRGLGEGDIWLGLFLGIAFPSAAELILILLLSYGVGAIIGLILMAGHKKEWRSKIALGPFLAFGAIITLIWAGTIINWYLMNIVKSF